MLTDSILRLKIAFANIPMRGLFFWEGLLFLKDDEYKKIVEGNFIDVMNTFPKEEKEATVYYKQILEDLKKAREDIFKDPEIRNEVEKEYKDIFNNPTQYSEEIKEKWMKHLPEIPQADHNYLTDEFFTQ